MTKLLTALMAFLMLVTVVRAEQRGVVIEREVRSGTIYLLIEGEDDGVSLSKYCVYLTKTTELRFDDGSSATYQNLVVGTSLTVEAHVEQANTPACALRVVIERVKGPRFLTKGTVVAVEGSRVTLSVDGRAVAFVLEAATPLYVADTKSPGIQDLVAGSVVRVFHGDAPEASGEGAVIKAVVFVAVGDV